MKRLIRFIIVVLILAGLGVGGYFPASAYLRERNKPTWRTAKVTSGDIVYEVNATGKVEPVLSVVVGSFVSGPISECRVDFNDQVEAGQIMAVVDRRLYEADRLRADATLETRKAEVSRVTAQLQQAINDEKRALSLQQINSEYISDAEMDQFKFNRLALEAQVRVAEKAIEQAKAALQTSEQNLDYCEITSPVDGIVVDRKIDPGQTLASQFQTPELFEVAPDLRKEIYVFAQIDETDIGLIRAAFESKQPVRFQVDAYPEDVFVGKIKQLRLSAENTQNVVTYPVVITTTNPDMKLLPGMTATLSFQIESKKDVLRVPNSALRFYPDTEHVREQDKKILIGGARKDDDEEEEEVALSVTERVEAYQSRNKRHVWVQDGDKLKAVAVTTGISDNRNSEVVAGELKDGMLLVTGLDDKK